MTLSTLEQEIIRWLNANNIEYNNLKVKPNFNGVNINFKFYGERLSNKVLEEFINKFNIEVWSNKSIKLPYKNYNQEKRRYEDLYNHEYEFNLEDCV